MRFAVGIIILAITTSVSDAAQVHLKDGSIVVGKIKSLADGEDLVVDTKYMDDVEIEWDAVEEIRETQPVVVELFDGRRMSGQVVLNDQGLTITRGEEELLIPPEQVFAIDEDNVNFVDGLEANTDLGMNIVRGNNRVTQISFGGGIGYDAKNFETSVEGTTIVNEQTETQDTRRLTLSGSYIHKFVNNWTANGLYQFESDDQQGLDGRSLLGAGVGKRLVNQRRHRVNLIAGLAVNSEDFVDMTREESLEGLLGAYYRMRWAVDFDVSLLLFPSLEQGNRLRTQFDSTLSVDLLADLDLKFTFYNRSDSVPPPGNEKNDYGLTLGLSWEL